MPPPSPKRTCNIPKPAQEALDRIIPGRPVCQVATDADKLVGRDVRITSSDAIGCVINSVDAACIPGPR